MMQTPHTPLSRTEGPECSLALGQVAAVLRGCSVKGSISAWGGGPGAHGVLAQLTTAPTCLGRCLPSPPVPAGSGTCLPAPWT